MEKNAPKDIALEKVISLREEYNQARKEYDRLKFESELEICKKYIGKCFKTCSKRGDVNAILINGINENNCSFNSLRVSYYENDSDLGKSIDTLSDFSLEELNNEMKENWEDMWEEITTDEFSVYYVKVMTHIHNSGLAQLPNSKEIFCIHPFEQLRKIGNNITCLDCQTTWTRVG